MTIDKKSVRVSVSSDDGKMWRPTKGTRTTTNDMGGAILTARIPPDMLNPDDALRPTFRFDFSKEPS